MTAMLSKPLSGRPAALAVAAASLLLAACGGGGSGSEASPPASAVPAPGSGTYAWLLKAQGATSALRYGLSLVHPSDPATEWVIEEPGDSVTDALVVASGTADPASLSVRNLLPNTLVYIAGGDVRRMPLQANGLAPRSQVQRAGSSSACRFLVRGVDHANPDRSRFIVSTAGADGVCGTSDDGAAEVRLSSAAPGIALQTLTGSTPLAVIRDPASLAPRAWVGTTATVPWASGETPLTFRTTATQLTRVVASNHRALLAESNDGLALLEFAGGGTYSDTPLAPAGFTGWQAIGFDSGLFYAWRNSGGTGGTWQIIRAAAGVSNPPPLSSGVGEITAASLGRDQIYTTVFAPGTTQLLRVPKAVVGAPVQVLDSVPSGNTLAVLTSGTDVHLMASRSASGAYNLRVIDESGAVLYTSSATGGFPLLLADDSTLRLNFSENTNRFVFVDRFGARGFSDNQLFAFDVVNRRLTTVGTLPGAAEFGSSFVFAGTNAPGGGSIMAGFSVASLNGVLETAGSRAWSFDAAADNSLKLTSRRQ